MKGGINSSGSRLRTSLYGSKLHAHDLSQGQAWCKFNAPVHKKHPWLTLKKKSITTSAEAVFVSISSYFNTFTMCLSILHATPWYGNKTEVDSFPRTPIQFNTADGLSPPAPKTSRGCFLFLVPINLCSHHWKVKNAYKIFSMRFCCWKHSLKTQIAVTFKQQFYKQVR